MYPPNAVGTPLGIRVIWCAEGSKAPTLGGAARVTISCFLFLEARLGLTVL